MKQSNGNNQLNSEVNSVNGRVDKLKGLGSTKGRIWNKRRKNY